MRMLDYDRQFDAGSMERYYFKPALAQLGLSGYSWHDLRHYYASLCAAAGIEIRKVSRWMGHANINTTDSTTRTYSTAATTTRWTPSTPPLSVARPP